MIQESPQDDSSWTDLFYGLINSTPYTMELKDPDSEMLVLPPAPSTVVNKAKGGMVDKKSKPTNN